MDLVQQLFALADPAYRAFQMPLIPNLAPEAFIGVRTPALRALARALAGTGEGQAFLEDLPHRYFDENQLHAFLIARVRDPERCLALTEAFLPWVDNWATCDQLNPPAFRRHRETLEPRLEAWMASAHPYTRRFAIKQRMDLFLEEPWFDPALPARVAACCGEEYYVNMMVAWYFATALAKQYEAVLPLLEAGILPRWTHNKAIQKALESRRIPPDRQAYLKTLKI